MGMLDRLGQGLGRVVEAGVSLMVDWSLLLLTWEELVIEVLVEVGILSHS